MQQSDADVRVTKLSVLAFARRVQVDEKAVRKAIKNGRLERSIGYENGRPVILDAEVAEREWNDNRDPSRVRSAQKSAPAGATGGESGGSDPSGHTGTKTPPKKPASNRPDARRGKTTADERRLLIRAQRRREEMKNSILSRKFGPVEEYKRRETERVTRAKNQLLGVPSKAKQRLPHLTVADVSVLDTLIRECLTGLADRTAPDAEGSP